MSVFPTIFHLQPGCEKILRSQIKKVLSLGDMDAAITKTNPFKWEKWLKKRLAIRGAFSFTKGGLFFLSFFYRSAVALRNWAYDVQLLSSDKSKLLVVSIGSIACGGTRKTPLTAHIAEKIGKSVGILTSGYAAKQKNCMKTVSIAAQGDEAYLLSVKLPGAKVYANKKRILSARAAEEEGVSYLLMDSGLQHRALQRDIDIVTVNANDPFCGGYFLPRGYLKDLPSRLKVADWIVIMDSENKAQFETVKKKLQKFAPNAKYLGMCAAFAKPELIRNKKVGVFCGIAKPKTFVQMLEKEGCTIVSQMELSDHEPFENASEFVEKSKNMGAQFVVCTEKDFVKLAPVETEGTLPLELVVTPQYGIKEYDEMLDTISSKS